MLRLKAIMTNLRELMGGCPDCGSKLWRLRHDPGCDRERCRHNLQAIGCGGEVHRRW